MANSSGPRKFSEKIALHNQKQAEGNQAFEEIMREVLATKGPTYPKSQQHLHISSSMVGRAGSLPNVNQIGQSIDKSGIDLQSALNNLEDIKHGRDGRNDVRRNFDQKRSVSPYSVTYLSPPPDTSWRRTNSDSALHQSAMMSTNQQLDGFHQSLNSTPRRSTVHDVDSSMIVDDSSTIDSWDPGKHDRYLLNTSLPDDSRPKSCEVPGITIFPTQEDLNSMHNHLPHIPISSNTGSLPDLTSLHFPAPLTTPIDIDENAIGPNSPYQSGPDSPYSPHSPHSNANLSPPPPLALQQINNNNNNNMLYQSRSGGGNNGNDGVVVNNVSNHRQMSPGPSPSPTSSRRRHHHNINNLVIGNPRHQHHSNTSHSQHNQSQQQQHQQQQHQQQQHQQQHQQQQQQQQQQQVCYTQSSMRNTTSPPRITVEGLTMDTSALSLNGNSQYVASSGGHALGYPSSQQYHSLQQSQNYVPPQSPLQQPMAIGLHRSTTPSDHSCSAPTSPVSHNISPINSPDLPTNHLSKSPFTDNSYFNVQQTSVLQHQLEQFRMVSDLQPDNTDHYLMMPGNGTIHSSSSSASSSTGGLYMSANSTIPASPRGSLSDAAGNIDYSPQPSPQSIINNNSNCLDSQPVTIYYTSSSRGSLIQSPTLAYSKSVISSPNAYQQTTGSNQPQTPQTPTGIPDIILTGPNIDDPLLRGQDFAKDIGTAMASMSGSFDANDLFPSAEEAMRAGLDPIDFDGLQILPDIDTSNDEAFRLERS